MICVLCQLHRGDQAVRAAACGITRMLPDLMNPPHQQPPAQHLHTRMHRSEKHQSVIQPAWNTLEHALISASDLSGLLEHSNLPVLQRLTEQHPARLLLPERWLSDVAPCYRHARWASSHALHAAAAE